MKVKSIKLKLCVLMTILISTISIVMGIWSIRNTNRIVQKEIGKLNNQILDETAFNVSMLLANVEQISDEIVEDNKLVDILAKSNESINSDNSKNKTESGYIEGVLNEKNWKYGDVNMKPELYVVGSNGMTFSTYSKTKYDIESIKNENWYSQVLAGQGDIVLISTLEDQAGIGPYKSIFRMGRIIKDLINGDTLGILIIDISEKILYDAYKEKLSDGREIYILDSNSNIISAKDKRAIGTSYINDIDTGKYLEAESNYSIFRRSDLEYMKITADLEQYGWTIIEEIPLNIIKQPIDEIKTKFITTLSLVIVVFFIIIYNLSTWITKPILNIKKTVEGVMKGDLKTKILVKSKDEIGELEETFNLMITWLDESIDEIKEKEKQKRVAELSFLQAQINPHFIYNTLTGIRALVSMNKNEEAEEMLYRFTKLLRNILPKANELISLEEEIKIIREYIELQKFRYPNSFMVEVEIDENINEVKVPLLILQPLVENAIFYSMESENKDGIIEIKGYEKENRIYIEIQDNGKGMDREKIRSVFNNKESINRVGLINVHERIQLNYGSNYGVNIESDEGKGTKVIVCLPK